MEKEKTQVLEIAEILHSLGLRLSEQQLSDLAAYVDNLIDWNGRINLVSRRDIGNIWMGHILHSLLPLTRISIPRKAKILDIGSGGGLPGIPIAIVRDDSYVVLIDSIRKKASALLDITRELKLTNVSVVCGRVETVEVENTVPDGFDVYTARGVAPLVDLIRWISPKAKKSRPGEMETAELKKCFDTPFLLAMKGGDLEQEIETAKNEFADKKISLVDLSFDGCEKLGMESKKVVVVEF